MFGRRATSNNGQFSASDVDWLIAQMNRLKQPLGSELKFTPEESASYRERVDRMVQIAIAHKEQIEPRTVVALILRQLVYNVQDWMGWADYFRSTYGLEPLIRVGASGPFLTTAEQVQQMTENEAIAVASKLSTGLPVIPEKPQLPVNQERLPTQQQAANSTSLEQSKSEIVNPESESLSGMIAAHSAEIRYAKSEELGEFSGTASDGLTKTGLAIAEGYNEQLMSGRDKRSAFYYLPEDSCDVPGLRYISPVIRKPVAKTYQQIEGITAEALSNAGIDPSVKYLFRKLSSNRFALDIPKPSKGWESPSLLKFLMGKEGDRIVADKSNPSRIFDFMNYLEKRIQGDESDPVLTEEELRVYLGVDMFGRARTLKLLSETSAGVAITGGSRIGKSSILLAIAFQLIGGLAPWQVQIVGLDYKYDGPTLPLLKEYPHVYGDIATDASSGVALLESVERRIIERSKLLGKFKCTNIFEFKRRYPEAKGGEDLALLPILLDEGHGFVEATGKEEALRWINKITSSWGAYGAALINTVQDGKEEFGLAPTTRTNLRSKVVLNSTKLCAGRILDSSEWAELAKVLMDRGDMIFTADADQVLTHGQAFYIEPAMVVSFAPLIKSKYQNWELTQKSDRTLNGRDRDLMQLIQGQTEEPSFPPQPSEELPASPEDGDFAKDLERCQLLIKTIIHNRDNPKNRIPLNKTLIEVVGRYAYPDDPNKVTRGANRDRGIKRLQELALKFGHRLTDKDMEVLKAS